MTSLRAFAENGEIFLGHEQPKVIWFDDFIFQLIHSLGARGVRRHFGEEVTKHLHSKELMNPDLIPAPALEQNVTARC